MEFLVERKTCQNPNCGKEVTHLVNDKLCMKCYQREYYLKKTRPKRKRKKKQKRAWWMLP